MKVATFRSAGTVRVGMVSATKLTDLTGRFGIVDSRSLLADEALRRRLGEHERFDYALDEIELLPPVTDPAHIVGIGLNTWSHLEEAKNYFGAAASDRPSHPRLFLRGPASHVGHGDQLWLPRNATSFDYEGEIAIVIGRPGRCIARADAHRHIAGVACYNDGSIREFQKHSTQVTAGKNFDRSGSFGPWVVTNDEIADWRSLSLETRVNGECRQTLVMDDLIFGFDELVAYVSEAFALSTGDVIMSGSPAGIGAFTSNYLRPGDSVQIDIPQVGTLRNRVVAEPARPWEIA